MPWPSAPRVPLLPFPRGLSSSGHTPQSQRLFLQGTPTPAPPSSAFAGEQEAGAANGPDGMHPLPQPRTWPEGGPAGKARGVRTGGDPLTNRKLWKREEVSLGLEAVEPPAPEAAPPPNHHPLTSSGWIFLMPQGWSLRPSPYSVSYRAQGYRVSTMCVCV